MQVNWRKEQIPWAMAAGRAVLGPVLIAGERCGWNGITLAAIVVTALVSDIFDGVLARRWRCDTAGMRLFDTLADTFFYACVGVALWVGLPQVWRGNGSLLAMLLGAEAVNFGVALAKFGKPASYHSYLAKTWGLVLAVGVIAAFAAGHSNPLIPIALVIGVACNLEGIAMSAVLPVWQRDVKTLRAALRLRNEISGRAAGERRAVVKAAGAKPLGFRVTGRRMPGSAVALALCVLAAPAFGLEPGQTTYAGGTARIAPNTMGTVDLTSPSELVFNYKEPGGAPGQVRIAYAKIRSLEPRKDVVRHLGFLPAVGVGMVAARQRRYTLTISYTDASDVVQVAILEMAEREQVALQSVLRARAPQSCVIGPYFSGVCAANSVARQTAAAQAAAAK